MFTVNMGLNELKIVTKECYLEGHGVHLRVTEACWVLCGFRKAPRKIWGAVSGGSWALLGVVLGHPGRPLGAKLAPKKAQETDHKDVENRTFFDILWHAFFCF